MVFYKSNAMYLNILVFYVSIANIVVRMLQFEFPSQYHSESMLASALRNREKGSGIRLILDLGVRWIRRNCQEDLSKFASWLGPHRIRRRFSGGKMAHRMSSTNFLENQYFFIALYFYFFPRLLIKDVICKVALQIIWGKKYLGW